LVVGRDGLTIEIVTRKGSEDEKQKFIGAFSALVEVVLKKLVQEFDLGKFGAGAFDTDQYRFIFCEAGSEYLLVAIFDSMTLIDAVFPHTYLVADKAARIIEGRPASPVIPQLRTSPKYREIKRNLEDYQQGRVHTAEYIYKLCLVGDGGVGKTSMVQMYVHGIFPEAYKATIGTFITKKECKFEELNTSVRLLIWDLAGQTQFQRIWPDYLADANAAIIVFDLTDRASFDSVHMWYDQVKDAALPDVVMILTGNKVDLKNKRVISKEEGEALARELGLYYMETSAKDNINLDKIFEYIGLELIGVSKGEKLHKIDERLVNEVNLNAEYLISETQLRYLYNFLNKQLEVAINKNEVQKINKMMDLLREIEKRKI